MRINDAVTSGSPLRCDRKGELYVPPLSVRLFTKESRESKQRVTSALITLLWLHAYDTALITQVEKYAKTFKLKKVIDAAFALRAAKMLSITARSLFDPACQQGSEALQMIKENHLHRIIPGVDPGNKKTALVDTDSGLFIRSSTGTSFLDTPEHINSILTYMDSSHPDTSQLRQLRDYLVIQATGEEGAVWDEAFIKETQTALSATYSYQLLKDVKHSEKGKFTDSYYLAGGITEHSTQHFRKLQPTHKDSESKKIYTFSVVTRLPSYVQEHNLFKKLWMILSNLFDDKAHGHSWIELTSPEKQGDNLFSVGYYFNVKAPERCLLSPDPQSFVPTPPSLLCRETVKITEEQFHKAKKYLEEVQKMIDRSDKRIGDLPTTEDLTDKERSDIAAIYNTAMKSTCLSFANALREGITGIHYDDRSLLQRILFPTCLLHLIDRTFNPVWNATGSQAGSALGWPSRAEFPAYVAGRALRRK